MYQPFRLRPRCLSCFSNALGRALFAKVIRGGPFMLRDVKYRVCMGGMLLLNSTFVSALWAADEVRVLPAIALAVSGDQAGDLQDQDASQRPKDSILETQQQIAEACLPQLKELAVIDESSGGAVGKYSKRGDLHLFSAQYKEAVADYQKMVAIDPSQDSSHWRLGIAHFFAGDPEAAAAQFDKYHTFDQVDRENGIWRYLSHYRAFGPEKARQELLRYEKDDRPPFPEVYRLFDGSMTAEQVISSVPQNIAADDRESRLFYVDLYVGMHGVVQQKPEAAAAIRRAAGNRWPQTAGYGPRYMWHVAVLQYCELLKQNKPIP